MPRIAVTDDPPGEPVVPSEEAPAAAQLDPPVVAGDLIAPALVPPRGLVATTLVLLVATAAVAIAVAPPVQPTVHADLQLSDWQPDERQFTEITRRQDQLVAVAAALPTAPTPTSALVAEVVGWLAAEAELGAQGVRSDAHARAQLGRAEEGLRALAVLHGSDAVRGLAVQWGREVATAFAATAQLARARGVTVRDLVGSPDGAALHRIAPGFGPLIAQTGLERIGVGAGLHPAADLVVQALAQARFLQFAVRLPDPPRLDPQLQGLLLRFRIEAHEGLRIERKLALVAELVATDPSYPDHFVRGVLWARENRCDLALPAFARAVQTGQQPARAAANLRWCQRQLAVR